MQLSISDYCAKNVITLKPTSQIADVIQVLLHKRTDVTCVVDEDEKLIGIVSKYSLFREMLKGTDIRLPISSIITHDVVTLNRNDNFDIARNTLLQHKVAHGIVIDEHRRVHGIVTKSDIITGFLHEKELLVNQLSALIENLEDAVISINTEQQILTFNKKSEKMFNMKKEEVQYQPIQNLFPQLLDHFNETLQQHSPSKPQQVEIGEHILIASFIPIQFQHTISGAMVVLQDITKLETIATELESTKRLQHTLHHALAKNFDAIIITDAEGIITVVNDAFYDLFKITEAETLNQHWTTVIPEITFEQVLAGNRVEGDVRTILKNPCFISQDPIMQDDRLLGTITKVIFRNIDEWKDVFLRLEHLHNELNFYKGELQRITKQDSAFERIIGYNTKMVKIKNEALLAAGGSSTILITGESGTGKELFAEAIHEESRRTGRFIEVNCAAIPADLMESEFFGYTEGAFTGAKKGGKPGKFELAHQGTLFLDEIGDMPLPLQAKLLRVLQEQTFERIGDTVVRDADVRIIAATNKDLKKMVREGTFREDLYYRIDVVNIHIPPVRERIDDLTFLCDYLIKKLNEKMEKNVMGLTSAAVSILQNYDWPGNVRQLENILERAYNLGITKWIEPVHLPDSLIPLPIVQSTRLMSQPEKNHDSWTLETTEKQSIVQALAKANNNRSQAALILGIGRSTLYSKMRKYGLHK
ncbi:sigma 54-interacting transcriptional regulator [Sporosarcina sp. FSL W7-1349]|uniref:sigma 54-interacting transcriptional regulator n=1 Tax=Sporosarcina sp. FSL W7-1349 TaxID=2921561 RepID=UPI0030F7290D